MSQVIKWLKRPEAKTDSVKGKSVKKKQNFSFPGTDIYCDILDKRDIAGDQVFGVVLCHIAQSHCVLQAMKTDMEKRLPLEDA